MCNLALVSPGAGSSGDQAYGHVENIVRIGPRFAGTAAEATAASYIENQLRLYGLQTWVENFSIGTTYVVTENRLTMVQPVQMSITCVPAIYSPSTENVVTGQLMYAADWSTQNPEQLRGRVLLVESGEPITGLASIPPLAMIYFLENQPALTAIWPDGLASQCPAVSISGSDAHQLIELLGNGSVTVELRLTASSPPGTSQNVIARLPGSSDETIVVAAHHDSMLTPGAIDDASGVAVMLEIAHTLSTENLQRTVMFASFGGEELGLFGSADFVSKHKDDKLVAAIIFDCIAAGPDNGLRIGLTDSAQYGTTEWLDDFLQQVAENLGFCAWAESIEAVAGYSDHVSFTEAGIDASWIYWVNPTSYDIIGPVHTLSDNLSVVDNTRLQQTISLGVDAVRKLAAEDIEAWRWKYAFPTRMAVFAVAVLGALTISIGSSCFVHYRRDWAWRRAVLVVAVAVVATSSVAGFLLLR